MKKSNLTVGILYAAFGSMLLLAALLTKDKLSALLFGFSASCIFGGAVMIAKYFYWSAPKNKGRYQERMENETIELHDERNVKLRGKSGRYAYILGLMTIAAAIVVFAVLGALDIFDSRITMLFLGGYLVFQYVAGILFYKHLVKKY